MNLNNCKMTPFDSFILTGCIADLLKSVYMTVVGFIELFDFFVCIVFHWRSHADVIRKNKCLLTLCNIYQFIMFLSSLYRWQ